MGLFDFLKSDRQKEIEEAKKRIKEYEDTREEREKKQKEIKEQKAKEFEDKLNAITKWNIKIDDNFVKKDHEYKEIKYSNITPKTKKDKLSHFVVIDTETTGLNYTCGVIELSGIRFDNYEPTMSFDTFIKPKAKSWKNAEAINHISPEMVKDSPTIEQVAQSFIEFVGDYDIVGHNLEYDLGILEDKGIVFEGKRNYFDTLPIAQKHLKKPKTKWNKEFEMYEIDYESDWDVEDHKLETLCDYYEIERNDAHMSDSDCLADGLVLLEMADEIIE